MSLVAFHWSNLINLQLQKKWIWSQGHCQKSWAMYSTWNKSPSSPPSDVLMLWFPHWGLKLPTFSKVTTLSTHQLYLLTLSKNHIWLFLYIYKCLKNHRHCPRIALFPTWVSLSLKRWLLSGLHSYMCVTIVKASRQKAMQFLNVFIHRLGSSSCAAGGCRKQAAKSLLVPEVRGN